MDKFVPKEYIEKFIPTNRSEKTQMEVFFEFISAQIFNNEEYTVEDFVYLNNDDLLESLKYYIKCNKVTAKGTAKAYLGYLKNFFVNLEGYYKVNSDIFVNGNFLQALWDEADKIISLLNDKEETNTNIATNEEYDNLVQKIKEAVLSSKGQITVPKVIREILHIDNGDSIAFYVDGNEVMLTSSNNLNISMKNKDLKTIVKKGEK